MGHTTFLLISILFLLNVQPSSPSSIGLNLVNTLRRKLLQVATTFTTLTPDNTHLQLCDTDMSHMRPTPGRIPAPDGVHKKMNSMFIKKIEYCIFKRTSLLQGNTHVVYHSRTLRRQQTNLAGNLTELQQQQLAALNSD
jgi:hypothetical protein